MFIFVGVKKHVIMFLCSKALGGFQNGGGKGDGYMRKKNDMAEGRKCGMKRFPFRGFNEIPVLVAKMYF